MKAVEPSVTEHIFEFDTLPNLTIRVRAYGDGTVYIALDDILEREGATIGANGFDDFMSVLDWASKLADLTRDEVEKSTELERRISDALCLLKEAEFVDNDDYNRLYGALTGDLEYGIGQSLDSVIDWLVSRVDEWSMDQKRALADACSKWCPF